MLVSVVLVQALLPILAFGTAVLRSNKKFDYDSLSLREVGSRNTMEWRVWLELDGDPISFWHDVPLYPDSTNKQIVNFVVEIPRWTDGKIEIRRPDPLNPIFHDDKDDAARFVESIWPHRSYPFVYGSIPQTWESPNFDHPYTNVPGDNDPVDLFDIGQDVGYTGQVKQVKVLGALAPNDGGETDWKVLGIDVSDPLAPFVDNFSDVEKYRPGLIKAYRDWFTYYKVARGDGVIPLIGPGNGWHNASFAAQVIHESHGYWEELIAGDVDTGKINYNQTSHPDVEGSYVQSKKATKELDLPKKSKVGKPAERPGRFDQWFYLDEDFQLIETPTKV